MEKETLFLFSSIKSILSAGIVLTATMFSLRYSLTPSWTTCLLVLCILDVLTTAAVQQSQPQLKSRRSRQMSPLSTSMSSGNLSESAESKVERLGQAFKRNVRELREKSSCLDLVFLVDESSSVGANNFLSELRFIRKMLSDFPVAPEDTRVALVTFSSKTHVVTRVDYISAPKSHQHKCSLFNKEIPAINYRGGGTYTKGAFQRAAVSHINETHFHCHLSTPLLFFLYCAYFLFS